MIDEQMAPARRRISAHSMMLRRRRIFTRLREGLSCDEIADEEGVTSQRIRQIVAEVLRKRAIEGGSEHAKLQLERLAPVMQLAADAIAAGDVTAISPYLKVLDRFDRYQTVAGADEAYDDESRRKLFDKINRAAANLDIDEVMRAAAHEHLRKLEMSPQEKGKTEGDAPPDPGHAPGEEKNSLSRPQALEKSGFGGTKASKFMRFYFSGLSWACFYSAAASAARRGLAASARRDEATLQPRIPMMVALFPARVERAPQWGYGRRWRFDAPRGMSS